MRPKNSQKNRKSTNTLYSFFNREHGVGSTKLSASRPSIHSKDVIVIDSDSEEELQAAQASGKKKRRRMSESSGEIEFVGQTTTKRPTLNTTGSHTSSKSATQGKQPAKDEIANPVSPILFGEPWGLLRPKAPSLPSKEVRQRSLSYDITIKSDSMTFGNPSSLLSLTDRQSSPSIAQLSSTVTLRSAEGLTVPGKEMDAHTQLLYEVDSDWETGDDEVAIVSAQQDEADDDLESVLPDGPSTGRPTGQLSNCPLCEKQFLLDELEAHSKQCFQSVSDEMSISSVFVSTNQNDKTFRPLASAQPRKFQQPVDCDGKFTIGASDAFSVLMTSCEGSKTESDDQKFHLSKKVSGRRPAPFYKVLQGMPIAVDAFQYGTIPGVTAYFLTHAHSDHYTNLSSTWKSGPIYCSKGTANLIIHMLSVDPKWVNILPMDIPTIIPNTGGVCVTLIDANHCPGSCLFNFEGPQTINAGDSTFQSSFVGSSRIFRYLHCGDFRASPQHVLHPSVKGKYIDHVYLDTTYLDPKYLFPPQSLVISACAELAKNIASGRPLTKNASTMDSWVTPHKGGKATTQKKEDKILVVIGTYSIGKERIVKAVAHALNTRVYCDARKAAILRCQADSDLNDLLTANPLDACVHIVPLGMIASDKLKAYGERFKDHFSKVVGIRPTGWTYVRPAGAQQTPTISSIISRSQQQNYTYANIQPARNSTSTVQMFPVPYSEHSSFSELTCFAMSFEWGKMIATVNVGSEKSRKKMATWFTKWQEEKKKKGKDFSVSYRQPDYW